MTLKVGLLGTGGIAARHADAIAKVSGLQLTACCGRDTDRTAHFAAPRDAAPYVDFDQMLASEELDLLIVTLPPYAHDGQVEKAAQRGINLLVEKPIALDMERANAMLDASENVVAACGFMYRFGGAVERWEELRRLSQTGPIAHFSGSFHSNALHADWWRDRALSGGQLVEQFIHIVDLARLNLGMPRSVFASASNAFHTQVPDYTSEDVSALILTYDSGAVCALHASNIAIPGQWAKQWQIIGEKLIGRFTGWNDAEITATRLSEEANGVAENELIAATQDPFVGQLDDVKHAILNKTAPRVPLQDGADTLRIVLAARQSADERREVVL